MDRVQAIANPTRREILRLVWDRELPASEIAARVNLTGPATSQHLRVLKAADLVAVRIDANRRLYRIHPKGLEELRSVLESFWTGRLASLKRVAEELHAEEEPNRDDR
jgi:DNA-binding transcriptional ArsR family regulator